MKLDNDLPKSKNQLQVAVGVLISIVTILYWADLSLLGVPEDGASPHIILAKSILENTIAAAFAALVIALTYRLVIRIVEPGDRVIEVPPGVITNRLQENARKTSRYSFIGNTATFVTASVLPILCARAQRSGQSIRTQIFIIDPRDSAVLDAYIEHKSRVSVARSRIADADLAAWTRPAYEGRPETTGVALAKLYSCLYLCAYASKSSGIEISVYLRKSFTPFRADVSDREVILTQESAEESAVAFSGSGHFYGWYDKEAEALIRQCTEVPLTENIAVKRLVLAHPSSDKASIEKSFRDLFSIALGSYEFAIPTDVEGAAVERIIRPTHSYAV